MPKIKNIISREIIDSRGFPTIETEVHLENGSIGIASVPSGSSTGSKEAIELRDRDNKRFFGKGVLNCIENIKKKILPNLIGINSYNQFDIDNIMIDLDGTNNKSNLGSNSILSVSLANARAYCKYKKIKLYEHIYDLYNNDDYIIPIPMINIINGGKHSNNNLDIQEFMILPIAETFKDSIRMASEIFYNLGLLLKKMNLSTNVGDEGGYSPNINTSEEALDIISYAIDNSNYIIGKDVLLAIDCASSEFYDKKNKKYNLIGEKKSLNIYEFTDYLNKLSEKYKIFSIEDGVYENDWEECKIQTNILGNKLQLVGDDIFVTNFNILKYGISINAYNSILIKYNQIGTLTETLKTIKLAKKNNYSTIISHRSGETEDNFISDLSIGVSSGQIKSGSVSRSERLSKYNQLIRIEEKLYNKKIFKFKYNKIY